MPAKVLELSLSLSQYGHCVCVCVCVCARARAQSLSHVGLLKTLQPARLLCPCDFPSKNAGVGYHALLQGIFPTQGLNPRLLHLLHWQVDFLPLSHLGCPGMAIT